MTRISSRSARTFVLLAACFLLTRCSDSGSAADTSGAPIPGAGGAIARSAVATTDGTISWTAATDGATAAADLEYLVYTSATNNLNTVADIEANGAAQGSYTANLVTKTLTGLAPGTTYYANVIVRDASGEKAAYVAKDVVTTNHAFIFTEGVSRNADVATAGGEATGRAGVDSLCNAKRLATHSGLACNHTRGLLTISAADEIRDFPTNYSYPASVEIQSAVGGTIVNDFADLLDGDVDVGMQLAAVTSGDYWTGSQVDGSFDNSTDNQCLGFTTSVAGGGVNEAVVGDPTSANSDWINTSAANCSSSFEYLCLCW